jgi:hypothetical protein
MWPVTSSRSGARLSRSAKNRSASSMRCTSVDDYYISISLPRIEWATFTSPMIGDSTLRASLDRYHLLGIEPVVDPISPMLHQLRARADQRERSVLLVEPFHSRIIEMRKLQFDDIAIPCLGVLNLLVVRQGREGGPESVGTRSVLVSMPRSRRRLLSVLFDSGASFEQENAYRRWPVSF